MRRKQFVLTSAIVMIVGAVCINCFFHQSRLDGSTVESRELRLNQSDHGIHIVSEITLDEQIISGIVGLNNAYGLAIFEPKDNHQYRFQTRFLIDNSEIIVAHTIVSKTGYDLFWCNQADLDYAKITYTVEGKKLEPIRLDAKENKILYHQAPSNDYTVEVAFYDRQGNRHE